MKNLNGYRWLGGAAALLVALANASPAPGMEAAGGGAPVLNIKSQVEAPGTQVLLRDLVEDAANLPPGWADRVVMAAPETLEPQPYDLTTIAYALQKYPDMEDIVLRGQLDLTIARQGRMVEPDELTAAVEAYVAAKELSLDRQFKIEYTRLPKRFAVPRGDLQVRVVSEQPAGADADDQAFNLEILVNGQVCKQLAITATVRLLEEVWVATRPIDAGQLLSLEDLEPRLMPVRQGTLICIPVSRSISGLEVNRAVRAGDPIAQSALRTPQCVRKGEYITVYASRGTVHITLRARALSTGRLGDRILCMNETSKRQILIQLTGQQQGECIKI